VKFIVDTNVGKLAKWLRMLGYDAVFFTGKDDAELVSRAFKEGRVLLTRDTHIMEWGVVRDGRVRTLLIKSDIPDRQVVQVLQELELRERPEPFSICLDCNSPMVKVEKQGAADMVPPYVFRTQDDFRSCPVCHRIYWRGTHWDIMKRRIENLKLDPSNNNNRS
jgi:uncharacterized protein